MPLDKAYSGFILGWLKKHTGLGGENALSIGGKKFPTVIPSFAANFASKCPYHDWTDARPGFTTLPCRVV